MAWEWLNIIGIIAFASSGAIVAIEEKYDILGVLFLGFAASFGGGLLRNALIGKPLTLLWEQETLLAVALGAMLIVYALPRRWLFQWRRLEVFFDALGLAAFSIQAAIWTTHLGYPLDVVIVAALLTGSGGGIIRDLLAQRKPMVFQPGNIYGLWAMLAAAAIGLGWPQHGWPLAALVVGITGLRVVSVVQRWSLPHREL